MRIILLLMGFLMIFVQQNVSSKGQIIIFFVGIILLGIPHGAADLLVATQNADSKKRIFSSINFFVNYLGRLIAFAAILWFFPLIGNISFIFLAAYHFGETDLYKFKTNTFSGKLLVLAYGLVILSVILLPHFEEVRPIFQLFKAGSDNLGFINWLDLHRNLLIFFFWNFTFCKCFCLFFKK